MNFNVHPKWSPAHRLACFALYRALLIQCLHVPLPQDRRHALQTLVRGTFRRNKEVQSAKWLTQGFNAGYEALELLRSAASGDQTSITRVLDLLSKVSPIPTARTSHDLPAKPPSSSQPATTTTTRAKKGHVGPWPGATPVLSRPHLKISGRRHIPILANANTFPFLRFKKPQSPFLSRVLRDKIKQKTKRFTTLLDLEDALDEAKAEDVWDTHVARATTTTRGRLPMTGSSKRVNSRKRSKAEPAWAAAIEYTMSYIKAQIGVTDEKKAALAEKMYDIIDKERELARKERLERRRLRKASEGLDGGA